MDCSTADVVREIGKIIALVCMFGFIAFMAWLMYKD